MRDLVFSSAQWSTLRQCFYAPCCVKIFADAMNSACHALAQFLTLRGLAQLACVDRASYGRARRVRASVVERTYWKLQLLYSTDRASVALYACIAQMDLAQASTDVSEQKDDGNVPAAARLSIPQFGLKCAHVSGRGGPVLHALVATSHLAIRAEFCGARVTFAQLESDNEGDRSDTKTRTRINGMRAAPLAAMLQERCPVAVGSSTTAPIFESSKSAPLSIPVFRTASFPAPTTDAVAWRKRNWRAACGIACFSPSAPAAHHCVCRSLSDSTPEAAPVRIPLLAVSQSEMHRAEDNDAAPKPHVTNRLIGAQKWRDGQRRRVNFTCFGVRAIMGFWKCGATSTSRTVAVQMACLAPLAQPEPPLRAHVYMHTTPLQGLVTRRGSIFVKVQVFVPCFVESPGF